MNHSLRLLSHIKKSQSPTGNFVGLSSSDKKFKISSPSFQTFHTSLVLTALGSIDDPTADKILARGTQYLLAQKSAQWTWNYWDRNNPKSKTLPDDLDDTTVALSAIDSYDPNIINEKTMVAVVQSLLAAEESIGGPYNTWLLAGWKNGVWHDIDMGVNANIAGFLARKNISLPSLTEWIEQRITKSDYSSKYYSKIYILYFISKWYRGSLSSKLQKEAMELLSKKQNHLDAALLTSSLLGFGASSKEVTKNIQILQKCLDKTHTIIPSHRGDIEPFPFFIEEIKKGVPQYAGSSALTAACIVEALHLFERAKEQETKAAAALRAAAAFRRIGNLALKRFSSLPGIKKSASELISKLAHKDPTHEIALLPHWFADCLKKGAGLPLLPGEGDLRSKQGEGFLNKLGALNTLGWIGYTIVDKVLDGEDYKSLLPVANICIREVSDYYQKLFAHDPRAYRIVSEILDGIDQTNYWEHQNCKLQPHPDPLLKGEGAATSPSFRGGDARSATGGVQLPAKLPNYGNYLPLAEKSLGHALGPIALILCNKKISTAKRFTIAKNIKKFFIHYLIARQLNDDAHDWLEDLEQGFLNSASVELLKDWKLKNINLDTDKEKLQKIFWNKTIDVIAEDVLIHTKRARNILRKLKKTGVLDSTEKLENLLIPLEYSASMAIKERDSTNKFLKEYK